MAPLRSSKRKATRGGAKKGDPNDAKEHATAAHAKDSVADVDRATTTTTTTKTLEALLEELVASPTEHANNLPKLIAGIAASSRASASASLTTTGEWTPSLLRSLAAFLVDRQYAEYSMEHSMDASAPRDVYRKWLARQRETFVVLLLRLLAAESETTSQTGTACLAALMELVRSVSESNALGSFDHVLYERVVRAVCGRAGDVSADVVGSVVDVYSGKYADVHYWTCKVLAKISAEMVVLGVEEHGEEEDGAYCLRTCYDILLNITDAVAEFDDDALPSWCGASELGILAATNDGSTKRQRKRVKAAGAEEDDKNTGTNGNMMNTKSNSNTNTNTVHAKWSSRKLRQRAVSDAWIEFLKVQVPVDCYRSLLTRLHNTIIPALVNPLLLSDFLTHALDRGGMDGMLALNGIFILVTQHGLEYPKFYERLYGLLNSDVFLSKHRVRFFQLADIFLASPMVPAYTAAAFAKKFARLGMRGSPATAIVAIAFIHNIVRRHPSCVQILNRPKNARGTAGNSGTSDAEVWHGVDVYDEDEPDPAESRALESSLWELSVFRNHADATVSAYCSSMLDKDMTNKVKSAEIDMSEVLGMSYASLFDREVTRKIKSVSTTVYAGSRGGVPRKLFRNCLGDGDDGNDGNGHDGAANSPFPGFTI